MTSNKPMTKHFPPTKRSVNLKIMQITSRSEKKWGVELKKDRRIIRQVKKRTKSAGAWDMNEMNIKKYKANG